VTRTFAREHGVAIALKGAGTVIAGPTATLAINPTAIRGNGQGRLGDVLTGSSGALLAREIRAAAALQAAATSTGLAPTCGARRGEYGMLASDIIESLPAALRALVEGAA